MLSEKVSSLKWNTLFLCAQRLSSLQGLFLQLEFCPVGSQWIWHTRGLPCPGHTLRMAAPKGLGLAARPASAQAPSCRGSARSPVTLHVGFEVWPSSADIAFTISTNWYSKSIPLYSKLSPKYHISGILLMFLGKRARLGWKEICHTGMAQRSTRSPG